MKSLSDASKKDAAKVTRSRLAEVFASAEETLKDYDPFVDEKTGTVVVDGSTFSCVEGKLRIMGFCPNCAMEVPSTPIRRLADVFDQRENFRPAKHSCAHD